MGIIRPSDRDHRGALFARLWTPDGLATQAGEQTFWDRATLYALRGVLAAGETERAMAVSDVLFNRRLLGEHVPYPVEAWPEGNQRHLAAESAWYCRVFIEGLFGMRPDRSALIHADASSAERLELDAAE